MVVGQVDPDPRSRRHALGRRRLLDVAWEQGLSPDHQPLDLGGALVQLHDFRAAH